MCIYRFGLGALFVVWCSAGLSQEVKDIQSFYRSLEPEIRADYQKFWDGVALEDKRKIARGKAPSSSSERAEGEKGIKSVLYNVAVAKAICVERAFNRASGVDQRMQVMNNCLKEKTDVLLKFSKASEYAPVVPRLKSAQCEMRSRDYDSELRFPPFEFLRGPDNHEPHLFDYKALLECLLSGRD
ncbi:MULTISPECIES: hypothetical protein [unclassified Bradyrhizobium]|uniref:hypothetical protein n=1 Tax=unclassified Bradyrhizobium TaxID=2631580 RepID=UPI0029168870|nr:MULTISPECIES: hypothetical protein [unclassified Bradyrhizobium]